jgi:hypothetical protein
LVPGAWQTAVETTRTTRTRSAEATISPGHVDHSENDHVTLSKEIDGRVGRILAERQTARVPHGNRSVTADAVRWQIDHRGVRHQQVAERSRG